VAVAAVAGMMLLLAPSWCIVEARDGAAVEVAARVIASPEMVWSDLKTESPIVTTLSVRSLSFRSRH
jgi:hypothetical protein